MNFHQAFFDELEKIALSPQEIGRLNVNKQTAAKSGKFVANHLARAKKSGMSGKPYSPARMAVIDRVMQRGQAAGSRARGLLGNPVDTSHHHPNLNTLPKNQWM